MQARAEQLFVQLQNTARIRALIGQSEDALLDYKEWPESESDAQKMLAKAACGLTNAEGGVLVIGMKARAVAKDEPDLVQSAVLVKDTSAVSSRVLDLVGQLVEPGIEAVRVIAVNESANDKSGCVASFKCKYFCRRASAVHS
jgi:predicted HTH transcriptional regulator